MEGLASAIPSGTATTSTTTTTLGHRRQLSVKNGLSPATSPIISLFITNLRLLDLDLLPEWPGITISCFGNQDARNRIRCTEFALYHLFRLYDPLLTADKLQPFFPPLEPMQSVNLRAALFRCLNEVKKNGVLPREAMVRKTMLDECQGDKFWEVCLAFSTAVLRKTVLDKQSKHAATIAERIGTASAVTRTEKESMLPLALAHKFALRKALDEKQKVRQSAAQINDFLNEKAAQLQRRKAAVQGYRASSVDMDRLRSVENAIENSWIGSVELKDALIGGDVCAQGDGVLLGSFDNLWKAEGRDRDAMSESSRAETGFLHQIQDTVQDQKQRFRKLQDLHEKLVTLNSESNPANDRSSVPPRSNIRFNRHRDLTIHSAPALDHSESREKQKRHESTRRYDQILTTMREELRKNTVYRNNANPPPTASPSSTATAAPSPHMIHPIRRAQTQRMPTRSSSVALDGSNDILHLHQRSTSQTAVPMRSKIGSRMSQRSRSYHQPKVSGQREPIPLKSELFSPLKDSRRSSASSSTLLATPAEGDEGEKTRGQPQFTEGVLSAIPICDAVNMAETPIGSTSDEDDNTPLVEYKPKESRGSGLFRSWTVTIPSPSDTANSRGNQQSNFSSTAVPPFRPSLAERTRMSMAFNSYNINNEEPLTSNGGDEDKTEQTSSEDDRPPTPPASRQPAVISLSERTRQSISFAPQTHYTSAHSHARPKRRSMSPTKPHAPIYPVNQFDTPQKLRPQPEYDDKLEQYERNENHMHDDPSATQRNVLSLEQLLSPDADYDSVFKSRPRIAVSPRASLSPQRL